MFTSLAAVEHLRGRRGVITALMCFAKMPVFVAAGFAAQRIGPPAFQAFLAALALVYLAMIWWAVSAH